MVNIYTNLLYLNFNWPHRTRRMLEEVMAVYQGLRTHQDIVVNMALEVIVKYDVIYKQAYDESKFCSALAPFSREISLRFTTALSFAAKMDTPPLQPLSRPPPL